MANGLLQMARQHEGLGGVATDTGAPPARQVLDALAGAGVGPVTQLGGIGIQGREFAIQGGADVHEPMGREGQAGAGGLPLGAGG